MNSKKIVAGLIIALIALSLIGFAYALTINVANARMILRANAGETISKTILVRNVNNISVEVESFASGDLKDTTIIKNPKFQLAPEEEGTINFTIKAEETGTTETKINIQFTPIEGSTSAGVGFSSNVIVIAGEGDGTDNSDSTEGGIGKIGIAITITAIVVILFIIVFAFYLKKGSNKEVSKSNKPKHEPK
jgi:flagellar basal body-associated protein FliL